MSDLTDDFYLRLKRIGSELTAEMGRPVTIREALLRLLETERLELGDLAWSWRFKELAGAERKLGGT